LFKQGTRAPWSTLFRKQAKRAKLMEVECQSYYCLMHSGMTTAKSPIHSTGRHSLCWSGH